jgi:hypothetical protein
MSAQAQKAAAPVSMRTLIEQRFSAPGYAVLHEVRNATGYSGVTRTADALVMSLWPSRGLELMGIEIKVTRGDWLRELADPAKAEAIQRYCDRWWLCVSDEGIVAPGELPATWGLLTYRRGRLEAKVEAPKLTAQPMDRKFLAGILRNVAVGYVPSSELDRLVEKRAQEAAAREREAAASVQRSLQHQIDDLNAAARAFREASGVDAFDRWHSGRIGQAVRQVLEKWDPKEAISQMRRIAQEAERTAAALERDLLNVEESVP